MYVTSVKQFIGCITGCIFFHLQTTMTYHPVKSETAFRKNKTTIYCASSCVVKVIHVVHSWEGYISIYVVITN